MPVHANVIDHAPVLVQSSRAKDEGYHWSHVEPLLPAQAHDPYRSRIPLLSHQNLRRNRSIPPCADLVLRIPWPSTHDNLLRTLVYALPNMQHARQDLLALLEMDCGLVLQVVHADEDADHHAATEHDTGPHVPSLPLA